MHRLPLLALGLLVLAAPLAAQTPDAVDDTALLQRYQATITPAELAGLLYVYADDHLAGRDTGEPGQRFAADFLAGQYQAMGIAPKGSDQEADNYSLAPYKQTFDLTQTQTSSMRYTAMRDGEEVLSGGAPAAEGSIVELVPVFGALPHDEEAVPVIWLGDASSIDGMDLTGAYLLATAPDQAAMQSLAMRLMATGARGVILPAAPSAMFLQGFAPDFPSSSLSLSTGEDEEAAGTVFVTGMDVAATLLGAEDASALAELPVGATGTTLQFSTEREVSPLETENVVAFIEGSDPDLKHEVVVISAHLDHVGDDGDGEDTVYNGADDDGSGTVAILEIAEAFQQAALDGYGPRRSVLFLHVTGEEKGLFGSQYYTDVDPRMPIEDTVANLNIDMIGRHDPSRDFETSDYVYIIGGDLISQDLDDWNATVNEATGTDLLLSDRFNSLDDPNQFFRRSDHWNFGKYDVPFIFYFTGTHADYHGVGDHPEKIDYDRLATITRLIFGTAWHTANTDARPEVSGTGLNP